MEGFSDGALIAGYEAAETPGDRQRFLALIASLRQCAFHLHIQAITKGVRTYFNPQFGGIAGRHAPMLLAIGWQAEADEMMRWLWKDYFASQADNADVVCGDPNRAGWVNEHSNTYVVNKPAWFNTMTAIDEGLWRARGYDPDMDSLGAYWMLAEVWNDPDPGKVRNALQAVREHNIGAAFIKDEPEGSRVYIVDEFLLLYDYDIRAVNMRRKLTGLDVVELETYIYDMDLPLEVPPFMKDDVFDPTYVKMCEEIGVAPYAPTNSVDIRIDPETLKTNLI